MKTGERYFLWMACVLLILNLIGFGPSYFFGQAFDAPPLPLRTHIHGVIFSAWFVLFLVQTALIETGKVEHHKRLGILATGLAGAMVISALTILYFRAREYNGDTDTLLTTATLIWGNLALLVAFTTFITLGFLNRHRPAAHKRLMLMASVSMMGQALGRMARIERLRFLDGDMMNEAAYGLGGLLLLLVSLAVHDMRTRGRIHPVTLWGAPIFMVSIAFIGVFVRQTGFGQALILLLN